MPKTGRLPASAQALRPAAFLALCGLLLSAVPVSAAPAALCHDITAATVAADVGATPDVRIWLPEDDVGRPAMPACNDWPASDGAVIVATAGRFVEPGAMPAIVQRFASPSRFTAIRYWSVTRQAWRPMIAAAHALAGADAQSRRGDVGTDTIVSGTTLHYLQRENGPTGEVVYRMDVLERSDDRLIIDQRNVTPVRLMLLPLFDAGAQRAMYVIEREAGDTWTYYQLARTPPLVTGAALKASYINRAVAVFRYIAGLPTDAAPPAAPQRQ